MRKVIALVFSMMVFVGVGCGDTSGDDGINNDPGPDDIRGDGGAPGTDPGECDLGSEGCTCNAGACLAGLECRSNLCVDVSGTGGTPGPGGTPGTGGTADLCAGVVCDDNNECTEGVCDQGSGTCSYPTKTDGVSCVSNGIPDGICESGTCREAMRCAGVVCDDNNECTDDVCDPGTGACSNPSKPVGTRCDGNRSVCDADRGFCPTVTQTVDPSIPRPSTIGAELYSDISSNYAVISQSYLKEFNPVVEGAWIHSTLRNGSVCDCRDNLGWSEYTGSLNQDIGFYANLPQYASPTHCNL